MSNKWRQRLRRAINERGLTMKSASLQSGLNPTAVYDVVVEEKDVKVSTLIKLITGLQLSYDEIMSGKTPIPEPTMVPVVGETAAGLWLEPDSWDEAKYPPVPIVPTRYPKLEQRAYRVIGPSMNLRGINDGSFVITVPYWQVRTTPQDGDIVVVERRRDGGLVERTVKEIVVLPDRIELMPRSSDERHREPFVIPRDSPQLAPEGPAEIEIVALVVGNYMPIGGGR